MKAQKKATRRHAAVAAAPAPAAPKAAWWYAAGIFALCYAGFQAYGQVLNGPFVFDDSYLPFRVPNFSSELRFWLGGMRPLLMLSYWVNFQISQTDTLWYHIFNVAFHAANSFLVFLIVSKVLGYVTADRPQRLLLAGFAAGLFLLHPAQTESVAYVASRSENLSLLFFLGAFTLFLYRRAEAVSWRVAFAVILLYGAAVSVKEHTVALIALLLLTDYYWNPGFSFSGIRRNWRMYGPIAVAAGAGVLFVLRVLRAASTAGFGLKEFTWYQYLFTECRAFFLYLRLFFFPLSQNADYDYPISHTILEHGAIFGLIGIAALATLAIVYRKRYPLASYGFFVYLALMAPTSSFIPIRDAVAERRLYLPMIGLLFMVTDLLRRVPLRRQALAWMLAALLAIAGVLAYQRNAVWTSDVALWQDVVEKSPHNPRAHFQLAYAYHYEAQRCDKALDEYAAVDRVAGPGYERRVELLIDWAEAYDCANQPDAALAKLREAAAREPSAHVFEELGMVAAKHDRYAEALESFATAEKADPGFLMTYVNRGALFQKMGQPGRAVEDYRRALAIEPGNRLALDGLAQALRRPAAR
jgi:protein O-mannosyl-transferase